MQKFYRELYRVSTVALRTKKRENEGGELKDEK